jgi:hypothetical protein
MPVHTPRHTVVFMLALALPSIAQADLAIYSDALANGFENWSYGGGSDFANPAPVHGGSLSIALSGNAWNALSFYHPGALASDDWAELRLWLHGGSGSGQALQLIVQNGGTVVAQAPLDAYLAGGPVAGSWREAHIAFAQAPLSYSGPFDRIDIQSNAAGTQPTVYFDDIALVAPASAVDAIFANGFEATLATTPLSIEHDVPAGGMTSDRFGWIDASGRPRSAALAHNNGQTGPAGSRGGELREFRYETAAGTRTVSATSDGFGGFGYVVSHPADQASHCTGGGDSSSLGHFTSGQFQRVFEGRHHAIFRFTQNYPRYCTANAPAQQYNLPVTIDWVFATGRDDPLWSITWDLSGVPVNRLEDDSRAPYGQMRIDGAASDAARTQIGGVAWGDRYRFASSTAPVTFASAWSWNQPNTIPFVQLWSHGVDAAMGLVQTRNIDQQDAGGYWGQGLWMQSSASISGCPGNYVMPCEYNWPFQSINYELAGGATRNARLAWGTNFGFLGQQQYRIRGNAWYGGGPLALPGDPMASGWPRKSYSTYIVLGEHSHEPVDAALTEVETIQGLVLGATTGTVVTQAPAGIADPALVTLQPAGYDGVYGALRFQASGGALAANIALGGGTLRNPLLIVGGIATLPASVSLNGMALVADVDYFASLRADTGELWLTLHRSLGGAANALTIQP